MQRSVALWRSNETGWTKRQAWTLPQDIDWEQKGLWEGPWIHQDKSSFRVEGEVRYLIRPIIHEIHSQEDYLNNQAFGSCSFSQPNNKRQRKRLCSQPLIEKLVLIIKHRCWGFRGYHYNHIQEAWWLF